MVRDKRTSASGDEGENVGTTIDLNSPFDPFHECSLLYGCCRGYRIRYQRLAALVASKFCIVAIIGGLASLFTKPKWYYIDRKNHMLAKSLLIFLLFALIVAASMARVKRHSWAPFLYVPYLVVGPLLVVYDIYKVVHHISEALGRSHPSYDSSPYIEFKVLLGCLEVIAVSVCLFVTYRAFKSMRAEKAASAPATAASASKA